VKQPTRLFRQKTPGFDQMFGLPQCAAGGTFVKKYLIPGQIGKFPSASNVHKNEHYEEHFS